jgi:hypothetical protein
MNNPSDRTTCRVPGILVNGTINMIPFVIMDLLVIAYAIPAVDSVNNLVAVIKKEKAGMRYATKNIRTITP